MSIFSLGAATIIGDLFNYLVYAICNPIYSLVSWLYQVYESVCSINLFSTEIFEEITGRIYVIIGIAMLFIFAYNLILMIINPDDKKNSGSMGTVVKETMISFIIVILLPTIFNYLYIIQSHILESNIITQIVLGSTGSTSGNKNNCDPDDYECSCDFSSLTRLDNYKGQFGFYIIFWKVKFNYSSNTDIKENLKNACNFSKDVLTPSQRGAFSIPSTVFSAFYYPSNFDLDDCYNYLKTGDETVINNDSDKQICVNYYYDVTMSKYVGSTIPMFKDNYLNDLASSNKGMEFHGILAIIGGCLAVWMFWCYTWEIGLRVAKLGFLQIISPIPVMLRIVPGQKEKIFADWFKQLKNTYIDVFIRLFIISFALFAISLVPDVVNTLWESSTSSSGGNILVNYVTGGYAVKILSVVILIFGIMKFAQEAPNLFKEIFHTTGDMKLRGLRKQISDNKAAMGAIGGVAAAAQTGVNNFNYSRGNPAGQRVRSVLGGIGSGFFRGARNGAQATDLRGLRNNISDSVDQALEARDRRDMRQNFVDPETGERGSFAYMAHRARKGLENWASGGLSYQALQQQQEILSKVQDSYKNIFDEAEKFLDKNKANLRITDTNGNTHSIAELELELEKAKNDHMTFNKEEYMRTTGATSDEADRKLASLREEAVKLETLYNASRKNIIDAIANNARNGGQITTARTLDASDQAATGLRTIEVSAVSDEKFQALQNAADSVRDNYSNELRQMHVEITDANGNAISNKEMKKSMERAQDDITEQMNAQRERRSS